MKTVTHHELCYYIKNRIKMILLKSIEITHFKIGVNKSNTSFIVNLNYKFGNDEKIFIKQYNLNTNKLDKSIYQAINDFDNLMN
jgi:hypothetical protein